MSIYQRPGKAVIRCTECDTEQVIEWAAGDQPILMPDHCGYTMVQVTHNDGRPITERCESYCCHPQFPPLPPDFFEQVKAGRKAAREAGQGVDSGRTGEQLAPSPPAPGGQSGAPSATGASKP